MLYRIKCVILILNWLHRCHLQYHWTYDRLKSFIAQESRKIGQRHNPHILLLHRLLDSHEKLTAGLDLIPILVQFCAKLKKHLDFKCHEQDASGMTLKVAVEKACSEMKSREEKMLLRRTLQNRFISEYTQKDANRSKTNIMLEMLLRQAWASPTQGKLNGDFLCICVYVHVCGPNILLYYSITLCKNGSHSRMAHIFR